MTFLTARLCSPWLSFVVHALEVNFCLTCFPALQHHLLLPPSQQFAAFISLCGKRCQFARSITLDLIPSSWSTQQLVYLTCFRKYFRLLKTFLVADSLAAQIYKKCTREAFVSTCRICLALLNRQNQFADQSSRHCCCLKCL